MITLIMVGAFCRTVVQGHSMDPTLCDGQNLLMIRTPLVAARQGDIVVAKWNGIRIVKRVVGCPGDHLEIRDNRLYRNGELLNEPYLQEAMLTRDLPGVTLAEDQYFLMGDNRNNSADSRVFGCFSEQALCGVIYPDRQPLLVAVYCTLVLSTVAMAASLFTEKKEANAHA